MTPSSWAVSLRVGPIRAERGLEVEVAELDSSSIAGVRASAADLADNDLQRDVLVANAGVMAAERGATGRRVTQTFGVEHLAHFFLTALSFRCWMQAGQVG